MNDYECVFQLIYKIRVHSLLVYLYTLIKNGHSFCKKYLNNYLSAFVAKITGDEGSQKDIKRMNGIQGLYINCKYELLYSSYRNIAIECDLLNHKKGQSSEIKIKNVCQQATVVCLAHRGHYSRHFNGQEIKFSV